MPPIQRCDRRDPESFCRCDDGGVDGPEREIAILSNKLSDPKPIRGTDGIDRERACGQVAEESHLRFGTQARLREIRDFRDDEERHDEGTFMVEQEGEAGLVVAVVLVDIGVQRA
jgi:hypothetical protein